jgi:calcineurin-like phosphoesterase family protein
MDSEMIYRWNSVVRKNDVVFHLGDFAFASTLEIELLLSKLNGNIQFVPGNHDRQLLKVRSACILKPIHEIKIDECFITLCHYPMISWNRSFHGSFMLHGHSHGTATYPYPNSRILDVGVDCHNSHPVSFEEIKNRLSSRPSPKDLVGSRVVDGG